MAPPSSSMGSWLKKLFERVERPGVPCHYCSNLSQESNYVKLSDIFKSSTRGCGACNILAVILEPYSSLPYVHIYPTAPTLELWFYDQAKRNTLEVFTSLSEQTQCTKPHKAG
jgi:hypothetical protein